MCLKVLDRFFSSWFYILKLFFLILSNCLSHIAAPRRPVAWLVEHSRHRSPEYKSSFWFRSEFDTMKTALALHVALCVPRNVSVYYQGTPCMPKPPGGSQACTPTPSSGQLLHLNELLSGLQKCESVDVGEWHLSLNQNWQMQR